MCALTGGRLAHLRGKFLEIRLARVEGVAFIVDDEVEDRPLRQTRRFVYHQPPVFDACANR